MKKYLLLLAVLVLCALAGLKGYNYVRDNKMSNFTKTYELYVYPEMKKRSLKRFAMGQESRIELA